MRVRVDLDFSFVVDLNLKRRDRKNLKDVGFTRATRKAANCQAAKTFEKLRIQLVVGLIMQTAALIWTLLNTTICRILKLS